MISLPQIAAAFVAVGTISGGALTLDKLHVASSDFKQYIEQQQASDEREYIQELKEDIREVRTLLLTHADDEYLEEELAAMMDELCELRPDDRLCEEDGSG